VVARVRGDGRPEDGLAGYYFRVTPNLTWSEGTPPLITGGAVGEVGFDVALDAEFGGGAYHEFVGGHGSTLFTPNAEGILFDVGSVAGGEVPAGAAARNVPWTRPVVLAVGGYDASQGAIDFSEEGSAPHYDANVFIREEGGGFRIIAADGTDIETGGASSNFAFEFEQPGGFYASLGSSAVIPTDEPVPLNIVLQQSIVPGIDGPLEGMAAEWVATRPVPEPTSATLLGLGAAWLLLRRRRR